MRFCPDCGNQLPDHVRFCTRCGKALEAAPAQPQQPQYQAPQQPQYPAPQPEYIPPAPAKKKKSPIAGILIGIVVILLVIGIAVGVGTLIDEGTRDFSCKELNMEIPLFMKDVSSNKDFKEYDFALDSSSVAVVGLREDKEDFEEGLTLREYTDLVLQANGWEVVSVDEQDDFCRFWVKSKGVSLTVYTFEAEDGFWMLQFTGTKNAYFSEMAESVTFD